MVLGVERSLAAKIMTLRKYMKQEIPRETEISLQVKKKERKNKWKGVTFLFGKCWLFWILMDYMSLKHHLSGLNDVSFQESNGHDRVLEDWKEAKIWGKQAKNRSCKSFQFFWLFTSLKMFYIFKLIIKVNFGNEGFIPSPLHIHTQKNTIKTTTTKL